MVLFFPPEMLSFSSILPNHVLLPKILLKIPSLINHFRLFFIPHLVPYCNHYSNLPNNSSSPRLFVCMGICRIYIHMHTYIVREREHSYMFYKCTCVLSFPISLDAASMPFMSSLLRFHKALSSACTSWVCSLPYYLLINLPGKSFHPFSCYAWWW